METREKIRQFVAALIEDQARGGRPADGAALQHYDLLDSLDIVKIVMFMEQEFGIDFSDLYFDQNDFKSIDAMVAFVDKHRADRSTAS